MSFDKNVFLSGEISKQNNSPVFYAFLLFFAYFAFKAVSPLINPLIWAAMLSFCIFPVYKKINIMTKNRFPSVSAGATLILLVFCVAVPFFLILASLTKEVSQLATVISAIIDKIQLGEIKDPAEFIPTWMPFWITKYIVSLLKDSSATKEIIQKIVELSGTALTTLSKILIRRASSFFFNIVVIVMVTFFLVRDGIYIINYSKSIIPLTEKEKNVFYKRGKKLLNSVVLGVIFSVAVQAILGGLGWWFCGLPNPSFFGVLMFIFGLFPAGSAVIWVPGVIYLLLIGNIKTGIILLVWGILVVGTVDNILRPFLISGGKEGEGIPTLLVVVGLFGGVFVWGFLGIFLGPLALVLFTVVLDIYRNRLLNQETTPN